MKQSIIFVFLLFVILFVLAFAPISQAGTSCSVDTLSITPGSNNYSFTGTSCDTSNSFDITLQYKNSSGTVVQSATQTQSAPGNYSFASSLSPTGTGTYTAVLTIVSKHYNMQCRNSPTTCETMAQLDYEQCQTGGGMEPLSAQPVMMFFPITDSCTTEYNQRMQQCQNICSGYNIDGLKPLSSKSVTKTYTPFYDNSTISTTPIKGSGRSLSLFSQSTDVNVSTSSFGSYYVTATIKNSSGTTVASRTSSTVAATSSSLALPTSSYTVPDYGSYSVIQKLYRENGATDTLLDTKTTSLSYACSQMDFYSSDMHDVDGSDGTVGFRIRPRLAKCNGTATLKVVVKNDVGTAVYTPSNKTFSSTSVELSTEPQTYSLSSLPGGSYTIEQTLSAAGFTTRTRSDTLTIQCNNPQLTGVSSVDTDGTDGNHGFTVNGSLAQCSGNSILEVSIKNSSGTEVYAAPDKTLSNSTANFGSVSQSYSFPALSSGTYTISQTLTDANGAVATKSDTFQIACSNPALTGLSALDKDGSDNTHGFTVNSSLASCNGTSNLAIVIKNSSGATAYTAPTKTVSSASGFPSAASTSYSFPALTSGSYTVHQTLTDNNGNSVTRVDAFDALCLNPQLTGLSGIDTDGTDGNHGFVSNGKLASCNGQSALEVSVKNSASSEVYAGTKTIGTTSGSQSSASATFSFPVLEPGSYSVQQTLTDSLGKTASRTDTLTITCNVFEASWGNPSLAEAPQDSFVVSANVTAPDACNGVITTRLQVLDGTNAVYDNSSKSLNSGSGMNGNLQWLFEQPIDDTTLTVKLTLDNGYGEQKILTDTVTLTCPSLFLPGNFGFNTENDRFSLTVSQGRACNGLGSINLKVLNPANNNAEVANASSTIDLTGATSNFVYDLPLSMPAEERAGVYSVFGEITDVKGSIKTFSHTFEIAPDNNGCQITSINPFNFNDQAIDFTFDTLDCASNTQYNYSFEITNESGSIVGQASLADISTGLHTLNPELLPTVPGLYTGTVIIEARTPVLMCSSSGLSCQQQGQLHYEYCIEQRDATHEKCQQEADSIEANCLAQCNNTDNGTLLQDTRQEVRQFRVVTDTSKILSTPTADALVINLSPDQVDVEVITSFYGDYLLRAEIFNESNVKLHEINQGPKTATSNALDYTTSSFTVPEFGTYRVRQTLLREGEILDTKDDLLELTCPAPVLSGIANINLSANDGVIDFDELSNAGSCNGQQTLSIVVKNASGVSVYESPSPKVISQPANIEQSIDSQVATNFELPMLPKGTYDVTAKLTDAIGNVITRTDPLNVSCNIFQAGLGDPALTEPTDNNFQLHADIFNSDQCNGNLRVNLKVSNNGETLFAADTQTIPSNSGPVNLDTSFELALDGALVDVVMTVENAFGDTEVYIQQVQVGCPGLFNLGPFDYDQQTSVFSMGVNNARACNGLGSIEYTVTDLETSSVINETNASIDLTGSTPVFKKPTSLDLPDNDIVGTYKVKGQVTDAFNNIKPFEYDFDLICPPMKIAGRRLGDAPVSTIYHRKGVAEFNRNNEIYYERTDICHTKPISKEQIGFSIQFDDGTSLDLSSADAIQNGTSTVNDLASFLYQITDVSLFGKVHSFNTTIKDETGTLQNSHSGAYAIACPIADLNFDTEIKDLNSYLTTLSRDARLACQDQVTYSFTAKYYDNEQAKFITVGQSTTETTTEPSINGEITWEPIIKDLGGETVKLDHYITFSTPFNIVHPIQKEQYYTIPCQPAQITSVHSAVQSRSQNSLSFKATYTPEMTCNGQTSINAYILDLDGNVVANTTSSVNSEVETEVEFSTEYIEPGSYRIRFEMLDSHGSETINEYDFSTPCSNPGVVSVIEPYYLNRDKVIVADFPSCNGTSTPKLLAQYKSGDQLPLTPVTLTGNASDYYYAFLPANNEGKNEVVIYSYYDGQTLEEAERYEHSFYFTQTFESPQLIINDVGYVHGEQYTVKSFNDITAKFNQQFSLPSDLVEVSSPEVTTTFTDFSTLLESNISRVGMIDAKYSLYDNELQSTFLGLQLIYRNTFDGTYYQASCDKYFEQQALTSLQAQALLTDDPVETVSNTFICRNLLPEVQGKFSLQHGVATRSNGDIVKLPLSSTSYSLSNAIGQAATGQVFNMFKLIDQTSNQSTGYPRIQNGQSFKSALYQPLVSGRYTLSTLIPIERQASQAVNVTFDYERPVEKISLKIPEGSSIAIDAAIPNSPEASYSQLATELEIEVEITKLSGDGVYSFEGVEVNSTPVTISVSKEIATLPSFKLMVKPVGDVLPAEYQVKPLATTVARMANVSIEPMVIDFNFKNAKESYFIGDPSVKIGVEPSSNSNCSYFTGANVSEQLTFVEPTCAFRWNIDGLEGLGVSGMGMTLRGMFTQSVTSVPYEVGFLYTSPETRATEFHATKSGAFSPQLIPPGQINVTSRQSYRLSRLGDGYYTYVGEYVPATLSVYGDVPGLKTKISIAGVETEELSTSTSDHFRIFTEATSVYESIPVRIQSDYLNFDTGTVIKDFDFISVPSAVALTLEQPESAVTGETTSFVATLHAITREGLKPYDSSLHGEWDVQLFTIDSSRQPQPASNVTPLSPSGDVVFEVNEPNPGTKKYYVEAYARPPAGINFEMTLKSRSVNLRVADGSPVEGMLGATKTIYRAPFSGSVIFYLKDNRRLSDIDYLEWYRSDDNGLTFSQIPGQTGRIAPFDFQQSGKQVFKAKIYNMHSGEVFETSPISIQAYNLPDISVQGDSTTFMGHPANLKASVTNGIPTEFKWQVKWGRLGEYVDYSGDNLELLSQDPGIYYIRLIAKEQGAPDLPQTNVVKLLYVSVNAPNLGRPVMIMDRSMELGKEHQVHFIPPTIYGGNNETLNVISEAVLPNGSTVNIPAEVHLPYTPTNSDIQNRALNFEYRAWVEGYKEQTLVESQRFAYAWEYAWPQWSIVSNTNNVEAPAKLRLTLKQTPFELPYQSLGDEPININWITQGEVNYQNGNRLDVTFAAPGDYEVTANISDTRGNQATAIKGDITLTPGPELGVTLIAGNHITDWVSPTYVQATTVTDSISAYDKIVSYEYYLNGSKQYYAPSSSSALIKVDNAGIHDLTVKVTTEKGDVLEKSVSMETKQNIPPSCEISPVNNGDSFHTFYVNCSDPDSRLASYEWFVDGEQISGSTNWIRLDSSASLSVMSVKSRVTDTKGAIVEKTWNR